MSTSKGRVIHLKAKLEEKRASAGTGPHIILRGNELYRLLSLINKVNWGHKLCAADEYDLQEIEDIEQGKRPLLHPKRRFFPPAFSRYDQHGVLCWFQDLRQGPLRALSAHETVLWRQMGPFGFHGYVRLNRTIQAYHLSGCEESPIPTTSSSPDPKH